MNKQNWIYKPWNTTNIDIFVLIHKPNIGITNQPIDQQISSNYLVAKNNIVIEVP